MATSLDLARTYTSYSGVDIRVVINGAQVGSMQALSYAIQREKAPIYVMGSVDPISYSRGKRGIAGTMISLMMDTHLLYSASFTGEYYMGDTDEYVAKIVKDGKVAKSTSGLSNLNNEVDSPVSLTTLGQISNFASDSDVGEDRTGNRSFTGVPGSAGAAFNPYVRSVNNRTYDVNNIGNNYRIAPVYYVDQILPFDISIVAANEYGQTAQMRLYGCEILNEGSGFSIDDIVIENQMTYVCRTILPWRSTEIQVKGVDGKEVDPRENLYGKIGNAENRGASMGGNDKKVSQYVMNRSDRV